MDARRALRPRLYLWVLGLLWVLPAALVGVAWLVLPHDPPPGQCGGLGFGCTLSPADAAVLMGVMAAPLLVTLGVVGVAVVALVRGVQARRGAPASAGQPPETTYRLSRSRSTCRSVHGNRTHRSSENSRVWSFDQGEVGSSDCP